MPELRFVNALRRRLARCGGTDQLAVEINAAHSGEEIKADYLSRLLRGDFKQVSIEKLEAIDAYLRIFGEGLAEKPLFESESLLQSLVANEKLEFFIPNRTDQRNRRDYVSAWAVRAFDVLLQSINQRWSQTRVNLHVEAQHDSGREPHDRNWEAVLSAEKSSFCAISSSIRVFGLSEYMLAKMLGVTPFVSPSIFRLNSPFFFIWQKPGSSYKQFESCFAVDVNAMLETELEVQHKDLLTAIKDNEAQAIVVAVDPDPKKWMVLESRWHQGVKSDYGVIVYQTQPNGGVWCVISGLSGPGMLAAAQLALEVKKGAPPCDEKGLAQPVYAIVKATINQRKTDNFADDRELVKNSAEFVVNPQTWPSR